MRDENVVLMMGLSFFAGLFLTVLIGALWSEPWNEIRVCSEFKDKCYNTTENTWMNGDLEYFNLTKIVISCEQEHQYKERICYSLTVR